MTPVTRELDIIEFATKVERLCDFFINQYTVHKGRDGSADLTALEKLRDDAIDIVHGTATFPIGGKAIEGLADAMGSLPISQEKQGT
jgi:hypothetical protein